MGIEIRCSIHESVVLLGLQKDGETWEPGSYVSKNSEKCPWSGDNGSGQLTLWQHNNMLFVWQNIKHIW